MKRSLQFRGGSYQLRQRAGEDYIERRQQTAVRQRQVLLLKTEKTDPCCEEMRLSIAIAVLVLAVIANSEAEEPTLEEQFAKFQNQMKDFADDVAVKTKSTLDQIHQSEFAAKTRNWFTEQFDKMKQKIDEAFQQK
ncbi:apolipoprotein C-I [Paramormyrops kingsleyae]|uniref:Apolipoprotein C1 n=1 Tax=Paramormyrops kingsleyae TaxID=1676925 RepID=A0A3B3QR43_9TELE|nr:apolipoprotein C-I [Paramormyrops kingsleyae]